jgi:hypothetical protein
VPDRRHEARARAERLTRVNVNFVGRAGAEVLADVPGLAASTGSACHAGSIELSPVLAAMGVPQRKGMEPAPELPVSTPQAGETLQYVATALAEGSTFPALQAALSRRRVADVRTELEGILRELYAVLFQHRRGLQLIDRCAQDHPDLARLWFLGGREVLLGLLVQYLDRRASRLRPVPDRAIAARMVIENLVFWAVHRHWDPAPQRMDEKVAEDTVVQLLLDALVKEVPA